MKTIGEQVKEFREARGWSTTQMAQAVARVHDRAVARQNIEQLEAAGQRRPRYLVALARVMGVTVEDLEGGRSTTKFQAADPRPDVAADDYRSAVNEAGSALASTLDDSQRLALISLMTTILDAPQLAQTIDLSQVIKWCAAKQSTKTTGSEIPGFVNTPLRSQLETIGAENISRRVADADDGEANQLGKREEPQQRPATGGR